MTTEWQHEIQYRCAFSTCCLLLISLSSLVALAFFCCSVSITISNAPYMEYCFTDFMRWWNSLVSSPSSSSGSSIGRPMYFLALDASVSRFWFRFLPFLGCGRHSCCRSCSDDINDVWEPGVSGRADSQGDVSLWIWVSIFILTVSLVLLICLKWRRVLDIGKCCRPGVSWYGD